MPSTQVFYEGNVQGVGFRYSVKQIARGFDLIGWVRNLPDGRVEVQVSGEAAELSSFLGAINESELRAHIKDHKVMPLADQPVIARGFEIRHA
jgi:acylphosphatase